MTTTDLVVFLAVSGLIVAGVGILILVMAGCFTRGDDDYDGE